MCLKIIFKVKNFILPCLDLYLPGILKREYVVKMRSGLKLKIRPKRKNIVSDIDIFKEIIIEDEYDFKKIIFSEDIIIDIGANVGFFSMQANKTKKGVKVYSYEPYIKTYQNLQSNILINNVKNIHSYKKAVVGQNRRVPIFISDENTGGHSIFDNGTSRKIDVEGVSLSEIIKNRKPTLLKIDCEGAEYEILLNTSKEILKKVDRIILEQHITPETLKKYKKDSLINYLEKCGFKTKIIKKISYPKEGEFWIIESKNGNSTNTLL